MALRKCIFVLKIIENGVTDVQYQYHHWNYQQASDIKVRGFYISTRMRTHGLLCTIARNGQTKSLCKGIKLLSSCHELAAYYLVSIRNNRLLWCGEWRTTV